MTGLLLVMQEIDWLNAVALLWFFCLWIGYARFAHFMARRSDNNLSSVMNSLRKRWMEQLIKRDLRIQDAALIGNLESNVTFLASSSMIILAGLLTALAATETIQAVIEEIPFSIDSNVFTLHIKLFLLILIYAYAFFTFSWSMRQYGFVSVVIGAAYTPEEAEVDPIKTATFIRVSAKVIDLAAHTYNYGLRAFYFSLSALGWFVSPWVFMGASALVVLVLYMREFHSRPLQELKNL